MTSNDQNGEATLPIQSPSGAVQVKRSNVPRDLPYLEYRQNLRHDFLCSCGYCTMSEAEAKAIRFTIDHYEPRQARPDLENEYTNLMYSCDECNMRKGDRCPPPEAREDGIRFFRPDEDVYEEHFQKSGIRLEPKSSAGEYTIEGLGLNRQALRRLRDIRERLTRCDQFVAQGVLGLRSFRIDQLPPGIKGAASRSIRDAERLANKIADEIDELLRAHAKSTLIDPDPEAPQRSLERAANLMRFEALHPGNWRAPRKRRSRHRRS